MKIASPADKKKIRATGADLPDLRLIVNYSSLLVRRNFSNELAYG